MRRLRRTDRHASHVLAFLAGGLLIIDHRNYDAILDTGKAPAKNLYYQGMCVYVCPCCFAMLGINVG